MIFYTLKFKAVEYRPSWQSFKIFSSSMAWKNKKKLKPFKTNIQYLVLFIKNTIFVIIQLIIQRIIFDGGRGVVQISYLVSLWLHNDYLQITKNCILINSIIKQIIMVLFPFYSEINHISSMVKKEKYLDLNLINDNFSHFLPPTRKGNKIILFSWKSKSRVWVYKKKKNIGTLIDG